MIKLGIAAKVLLGLALMVLAVIVAASLLSFTFREFQASFTDISTRKLPGLVGASQLMRETEQLIANAPDIIIARNQFIRGRLAQDIADKIQHKDALLAPLRQAEIPAADIDLLSRQFDLVFANLNTLIDISSRRFQIESRRWQMFLRLYRLSRHLDTLEHNTQPGFAPWHQAMKQAIVTMLFSERIENDRELSLAQKDTETLLADIERWSSASFDKAAASIQGEIVRYGSAADNIFQLRAQHLVLQNQISENLIQNKFLAAELAKTANRVFTGIQTTIDTQNARFGQDIRDISLMLVAVPGAGIFAVLLIYLYIRKSIIARILVLGRLMRDHVQGHPQPIPLQGNDEISDMARSVDYFIGEIQKREEKLEQARLVAEAANQAKSRFLASMSHELRTPLNAVLGYAKILRRNPEKLAEGTRIIEQSGTHLLDLINDLLDLAKIESGKLELDRQPLALPALLRGVVEIMRGRAEEKQLALGLEMDATLPASVAGDEKRLRQVLLNLLGNAVKFTDRGGVTLRATLLPPGDEPGVRVNFSIEDSGIGIPPEALEKIFQPFEQTAEARRRGEGTGLGLDISRRLVNLMGGDITVRSEAGQGSCFSFTLNWPVCEFAPPAARIRQISGYSGSRREILVVDDNPGNRAVLRALLEPLGFLLREAENGLHAVQQVKTHPPHLVLMDLMMPEMDGFEAARYIHALPNREQLPIVAVSASFPENLVKTDFHAFLPKPIDETQLWTVLADALNLTWEEAELVDTAAILELKIPPLAKLQELYDLAKLGKIPRIHAWADALEPDYTEFAETVRKSARLFDHAELIKLVERYR